MIAVRRLARVGQRAPLLTAFSVVSLADARTFSTTATERATASVALSANEKEQRAHTVNAAYARIIKKMATLFKKRSVDFENVEEEIEGAVMYLEDRLGMTRMRAIRTVALHPMIVAYSPEVMDSKLAVLESMGLTDDMLANAVRRCPNIVGITADTMERVRDWYLDMGIKPDKIPYMFSVYPQAMSYSTANKERKVQTLRDFGLNDVHICRILHRFPQILTGNADHFKAKVSALQADLGLSDEDIIKLIPVVPELLLSSVDRVKGKIAALDNLFGEGAGVKVWLTRPRVIMYNLKTIRQSTTYLTDVVGYPIERVATNISMVMRSLDRVIRPRYEFLSSIGAMDVIDNSRWIIMPDTTFKAQYPNYDAFLKMEFKAQKE